MGQCYLPADRSYKSRFRFIALTLPGVNDSAIAIAASRAGEWGILNLECCRDEETALAEILRLGHYARNECGIKIGPEAGAFTDRLAAHLPDIVRIVLLRFSKPEDLRSQVAAFRNKKKVTILLEVTTLEQARLGEEIGVDGLIAKGHEAGGWVGEETTFILLQQLLKRGSLPVWAHGGIGLHTAAACYAAGAAGVVLDAQLALTHESQLPVSVKHAIARMDGSETLCLGEELGRPFRIYSRPNLPVADELRRTVREYAEDFRPLDEAAVSWLEAIRARIGWESPERQIWPLGQDVAFAAPLAKKFRTVGSVLNAFRESVRNHVHAARELRPLSEGAALARSHHTRYPIVQGPMTRVSDTAAFAARVAEGGALPFLALALMRAPEVKALLEETQRLLDGRPWGVGILGFVPFDVRQEQLEVIRTYRPPFALIAGGRPDQARILEEEGIPTYLHVPSPGLLKIFLENGARRFVFEGRECGGHVGPRTSFVLWDMMIDVLLESLPPSDTEDCHILFAGGIHDALSSSMVAAMAAPLAERGARIGVLLGTAYILTKEAASTGAIVEGFQQEVIRCSRTVLLETGPGHSTRCADTHFCDVFKREKQRLSREGKSSEEIRNALDELNLGRLRIASKGVNRNPRYGHDPHVPKLIPVQEEEQHAQGMYMIGQLAVLRDQPCTIEELHRDVAVNGSERLGEVEEAEWSSISVLPKEQPCDIAIIGMASVLPKAGDLETYWENILNKVDAITEVPIERWDWRQYFDPDPKARDKVYCKWGGFIDPIPFDPTRYGIPPNTLFSIEPLQLLTLELVRKALENSGYAERPFPRERTSVILGVGGGAGDLGQQYAVRSALPMLIKDAPPDILAQLPDWTEDSFPGILLNVTAGRVANRFDLGGVNYVVDAACASSLAALSQGVRELEMGTSDMVITGGADTVQNPFAYLCFSKTQALSPRGRCRTFDESADGIVISEGVAILVLKRLEDAERDGDRIYAVIKSVGGSSDGRDRGLTAPRPEGQIRALERAYAKAGFSPATVGLIEAHGTGTVAGDQAEAESLIRVFNAAHAPRQICAIGSVKSMIGHTKCTAGVAGIIKVALSLYHKVLPPTLGVEKPNSKAGFGKSPIYVNTETRPWIGAPDHPRRAGVSAFGFGGTNFHTVLEEHTGAFLDSSTQAVLQHWPAELLLWMGESPQAILTAIEPIEQALVHGAKPALCDLAYTTFIIAQQHIKGKGTDRFRLSVIASSLEDLRDKLRVVRDALSMPAPQSIHDPRGIYFSEVSLGGKVAFLFSGQGSQYPDMLKDLVVYFPEARERFELADRVLSNRLPRRLSTYIFPSPRFSPEDEKACLQELTETNIAQPAIGVADMTLLALIKKLGVSPDMVAGHSYGEYVALCAAGVFDEETLYRVSEARGRFILEAAAGGDLGAMAAVEAERETVLPVLKTIEGVYLANLNAPQQTIISGARSAVQKAVELFKAEGMSARPIPVACGFHSPLMIPTKDRFAEFLSTLTFRPPRLEVFSNTYASPYPQNPREMVAILSEHLVRPVEFVREIEAMYDAGARIFVEIGPRNVLTALCQQILAGRPYTSVALDIPGRSGLVQLQHALAQLAAAGLPVRLDPIYQGRWVKKVDMSGLEKEAIENRPSPTTWLVDGGEARPLSREARRTHSGSKEIQQAAKSPEAGLRKEQPLSTIPALPAGSSRPMAKRVPDSGLPKDELDQVMIRYQRLMERFLETQKSVMLAYLQVTPLPSPAQTGVTARSVTEKGPGSASSEGAQTDSRSPGQAASAPPRSAEMNREYLTEKLLQLVSERTGYPLEMLGLDLNIEADLGIDSIKRVEILGALQRALPSERRLPQEAMERLTAIKTLRGILDWIEGALQPHSGIPAVGTFSDQAKGAATAVPTRETDGTVKVSRFLMRAVEAPLPSQSLPSVLDGIFIITDDEQGISQAVAAGLRRHGGQAVIVRAGSSVGKGDQDSYTGDLTDPASVSELLEAIRRQYGPIKGLIHLLPLRNRHGFEETDLKAWRERLRQEIKSLFYLAKAAAPDFKQTNGSVRSWLAAATAMGGAFTMDGVTNHSFFPGQAGLTGLIKTLAKEWPSVRCKVVDLEPNNPPSTLAGQILQEIAAEDEEVEVGYKGSRRLILRPTSTPLDLDRPPSPGMDSSWVVLVTGGARGITAQVACEMAARYRPTLLLIGRSPLPEPEESTQTAGLSSPQELKAALMDQIRRAGQPVTPARVETAYSRLLKDREIRSNLLAVERAGATVRYYQVDVRDETAFGNLIDEIYRSYGRIDGVIHGAGIIEDKLLDDKDPNSLDRVFDTKADSAFILSRKLRHDSLRFLIFFSSVAGCFGNRGQSDYAAANEVLNKLAVYLDGRWPGRIVSINWGPWEKTGMVSAEVLRQFSQRGVQLIPPLAGRDALDRELRYGQKGEVEVILGGGPWENMEVKKSVSSADSLPLLDGASLSIRGDGSVEVIYRLDPSVDLYLQDHQLDAKPVFPAAMAMELMAEVVQKGWPDRMVVGIQTFRVLRGIVLENGSQTVRVVARPQTQPSQERLELEVEVEIRELEQPARAFYRATVRLAQRLPDSPPNASSPFRDMHDFPMTVEEAYQRWLFHGPRFQGISKIKGINQQGIFAVLVPSFPGQCLLQNGSGPWLIDPVLVDCAFQLAILWERTHYDMTPLPSGFSSFRRFGSTPGLSVQCYLEAQSSADGHVLLTNIVFLDASGRMIGYMEGMEFSCSKALNRLAGPAASAQGEGL